MRSRFESEQPSSSDDLSNAVEEQNSPKDYSLDFMTSTSQSRMATCAEQKLLPLWTD